MTRDCDGCGRPVLHRDVDAILRLYGRCKAWNQLPEGGGIFDQDERVMGLLDAVEQIFADVRNKRQNDAAGEAQKERMMREL